MKAIAKYFFRGVLLTIPVLITGYIIFVLALKLEELYYWISGFSVDSRIPFLAYVLIDIVIIFIIGYFASHFFTKTVFSWFEKLFSKLPFIRLVYTAIRGVISAFVGEQRKFDKPVLVKINGTDLSRVGFLVQSDLSKLETPDLVAVYLPNALGISGGLYFAPKDNVKPLNISGLDAMNLAISGGLAELEMMKEKK